MEFENVFTFLFMFLKFCSPLKIIWNSKLFSMSKHMQVGKQSLCSACISTYITTEQLHMHVLNMSKLSMYQMGTTMLRWELLLNTPYMYHLIGMQPAGCSHAKRQGCIILTE